MPSCKNSGGKRRSRNRSRSRMHMRRSRGGASSSGFGALRMASVPPPSKGQPVGSYGASPYGPMMYTGKEAGGGFMPNATQNFYAGGKKRRMSKRKGRKGRKTKKHRKSKRHHKRGGKHSERGHR